VTIPMKRELKVKTKRYRLVASATHMQ